MESSCMRWIVQSSSPTFSRSHSFTCNPHLHKRLHRSTAWCFHFSSPPGEHKSADKGQCMIRTVCALNARAPTSTGAEAFRRSWQSRHRCAPLRRICPESPGWSAWQSWTPDRDTLRKHKFELSRPDWSCRGALTVIVVLLFVQDLQSDNQDTPQKWN